MQYGQLLLVHFVLVHYGSAWALQLFYHKLESQSMVLGSWLHYYAILFIVLLLKASNPGQFDNEGDSIWLRGNSGESVFYHVSW